MSIELGKQKIPKALLSLLVFGAIGATVFVFLVVSGQGIDVALLYQLPILLPGLLISHQIWINEKRRPKSDSEFTEIARAKHLREEKLEAISKSWYVRYLLSVLIMFLAFYIYQTEENNWWLALVLAVFAAVQAREVSILALILVAGYLVFKGIALLPVSFAIIVGAIIIANIF